MSTHFTFPLIFELLFYTPCSVSHSPHRLTVLCASECVHTLICFTVCSSYPQSLLLATDSASWVLSGYTQTLFIWNGDVKEREREMLWMSRGRLYISQILMYSLTMLLTCKSLLEIKCRFLLEHLYSWVLRRSLFSANLTICNYVNACTSVIHFFLFVLFCFAKEEMCFISMLLLWTGTAL